MCGVSSAVRRDLDRLESYFTEDRSCLRALAQAGHDPHELPKAPRGEGTRAILGYLDLGLY